MNENVTIEYKLSRSDKRKLQHKNEVRCENCNRYFSIDEDAWEEIMRNDSPYVYLCPKVKCKRSRPENLIDRKLISKDGQNNKGTMYHPVDGEKDLYKFYMLGF